MRAGLALMIIPLVLASPARACHRFHVWNYLTPQRCEVSDKSWYVEFVLPAADEKPAPPVSLMEPLPPFTVSKYDTIILRPDPRRTDEEGRALAIEILREVMGK